MDFDLTEEEQALRDLASEYARGEIAPNAQRWWDEACCPTDVLRAMGKLGLMGVLVPERYGGIGATTVGFVAAMEELGKADQSVAAAWQAHVTIGSLPLLYFATEEQKQRWLVPLAKGDALGAFGLTEPDAGSDVANISTRAEKHGDEWVINGRKMFISNAGTDMSFGVTVLARVGRKAERDGYASLVVPTGTPGYSFGEKLRGIGWRSLDTRELIFENVRVPADALLGDARRGLAQFLNVLEVGRISIAALSVSLAAAVLEQAFDYSKQRIQFGRPIIGNQAIQFKLADMATDLESVRWLTYRAAALRDAGKPFRKEAAMAKLKASAVANRVVSEALQIHGGYGYMLDSPVARFYCDAKVLEIGEGTNEIQRIVIARELGC
jgi:short/branched chain acyl-CoA dehydrogenase